MNSLTTKSKYTLVGLFFGLSFPVFSQFVDCWLSGLSFSWTSLVLLHEENVIHYVVDTAPIVLGLAGYLLGVTHQKKNEANEHLMKVIDSLDTLTYKITHDLRGPALNIKNLAEILLSAKSSLPASKQDEVLNKIHVSIDTWLHTFEDFMTLLKHEKSGDIEKLICNLDDSISHLQAELTNEIQGSAAIITTDFSKGSSVMASEMYLISIFKNLITNSIKYAHPDRKPEIHITSAKVGDRVKIKYTDNGSGIDLNTHGDKLFTLFKRFNENSKIPGSGVGLYLVKEQVEKNDGTIEVESIPNEGTIFTLHLPTT